MIPHPHSIDNLTYSTSELKLAALLIAEIPSSTFEILEDGDSPRKTIEILYPSKCKDTLIKLERGFINKQAFANIYLYNRALNMIRDELRGERENGKSTARRRTY